MSYGGGGTENAQETAKFLSHYLHGNPRPSGKKAREKRLSFLFLCF
jgi:hypothetical protein